MTIATLAARGVDGRVARGRSLDRAARRRSRARDVDIEPDLSNAAPFLAAALVDRRLGHDHRLAGGRPRRSAPTSPTSCRSSARRSPATATASPSPAGERIRGIALDLTTGGELAPALVALAALADGPSEITGIGHIRHHETDRLAALAAEINGLGGAVTELDDGLRIEPRPLHGGVWRSYEDHRMATAGAIIGLAVPGVEIENIATTAKTLPQFPELWTRMLRGSRDRV